MTMFLINFIAKATSHDIRNIWFIENKSFREVNDEDDIFKVKNL